MDNISRIVESTLEPVYRAARSPNQDELTRIANAIFDEVDLIAYEHPRKWNNYEALVGFQVGRAINYHQLSMPQYDWLVDWVMTKLQMRMDCIEHPTITIQKWNEHRQSHEEYSCQDHQSRIFKRP